MALDEERERRLKWRAAESVRRLVASDKFLHAYLPARLYNNRRLRPRLKTFHFMARRMKRNPVAFIEKSYGKEWFEGLRRLTRKQADRWLEHLEFWDRLVAGEILPSDVPPAGAKQALKLLASLAAGKPGRRRLEMYRQAYHLQQQGKKIPYICQRLTPGYTDFSVSEKRATRDRMRSGIRRVAEQLTRQTTATKSSK